MSAIQFYCVICGTPLSAELTSDARLMDCPRCKHVVPIPGAVDLLKGFAGDMPMLPKGVLAVEVKFLCTGCGRKLQVDARWQDRAVSCPNCQQTVSVPVWSREAGHATLTPEEMEFLSSAAPEMKLTPHAR